MQLEKRIDCMNGKVPLIARTDTHMTHARLCRHRRCYLILVNFKLHSPRAFIICDPSATTSILPTLMTNPISLHKARKRTEVLAGAATAFSFHSPRYDYRTWVEFLCLQTHQTDIVRFKSLNNRENCKFS